MPFRQTILRRIGTQCKSTAEGGTESAKYKVKSEKSPPSPFRLPPSAFPLPRPSADGKRICFNSSRSGTVDLCILYMEGNAPKAAEKRRSPADERVRFRRMNPIFFDPMNFS